MATIFIIAGGVLLAILLIALGVYAFNRSYVARSDRTFMTHDERGFRRALKGKGVIWDPEESVVRGPGSPNLSYVAVDLASGDRRMTPLIDQRTGGVNLRPQYCVPLPFYATTADAHRLIVECRVQFSLNRDLLKYVYQLEDFGLALETRIHSAFRAEIGMRQDEVLRGALHEVEAGVIERLRQAERDGDEAGEAGMALGVNFHTASFTYSEADADAPVTLSTMRAIAAPGAPASAGAVEAARVAARAQGVLALRPQQLDQLADVFKGRDPAATKALLAILEMQTRQNIAEALASSGQLVVVTAQELGLAGASAQRDAVARVAAQSAVNGASATPANGAGAHA
jgi:hypothetical protein